VLLANGVVADDDSSVAGRSEYRYYCYQCHGYSGDANTLASSYLNPKPRDFTANTAESLSEERMLDAVRNGRPGTAMASFATVLTDEEILDVVGYIRDSLMSGSAVNEKYHSVENGWIDHDRFAAAFPFIEGTVGVDTPWEDLDARQRYGKELYISACISCHDQANSAAGDTVWELRAVSFPRRHFSHRADPGEIVSGASPYAVHDIPVFPEGMSEQQSSGMRLYLDNCAFCHAADGTGRNWIGSFLDPRPRNFTDPGFTLTATPVALRERIKRGIPGTSMPAWKAVLRDDEIDDIIAYMQVAFGVR
jgi:cytochrome c oxidase cbb3-type subunit 3